MLDVLLVTGCVPPVPCGVGHYTARLAEALASAGLRAGLEVVDRWGGLKRLRARVAEERPPVAHVMYPTRGYGWSLYPAMIPRACRPARVLLHVHEYTNNHPLRRMLVRSMAARSWRVVVSTEYERSALAKFDPRVVPVPATVVGDPATVPPPPPPREKPSPLDVVFFGFVMPKKGVDVLVEACAKAGARLRLVGQTPEESAEYEASIVALARARGVALEKSGDVPDDRVIAELQRADVCALPFVDGASARHTTLLTALAAGVPVVTTTGPDVALRHGEEAWLVPPRDAGALAEALTRLVADAALRARLSERGRVFAARYGWGEVAKRIVDVYGSGSPSG